LFHESSTLLWLVAALADLTSQSSNHYSALPIRLNCGNHLVTRTSGQSRWDGAPNNPSCTVDGLLLVDGVDKVCDDIDLPSG